MLVDTLTRLDGALLELRRFLEGPRSPGGPVPADVPADALERAGRVELSTVLVVNALVAEGVDGCDVTAVAERLQVAHSTASRLVERAVRAGMVHRTRSAGNARRSHLTLTREGQGLYAEALRFRTDRLARILASWPAHEVATLADLLERFAHDAHHQPTLENP